MKKMLMFCFLLLCLLGSNAFAYDKHGYPYNTTSNCMLSSCPLDDLGFYQNNCTSYAAYMLSGYVWNFSNSYGGTSWGNAGNWNDAASQMSGQNIVVDSYPLPGDIAYWEYNWTGNPSNTYDDYGHVAWVEKVNFDSNGNPVSVDITEYNYNTQCGFGQRTVSVDDVSGFIHILAYEEGVSSLYYLDCYEMDLVCDTQTKQEWGWIADRAWNNYRCTNCSGNYPVAYVNAIAGAMGGMGGGPGGETQPTDTETPNLPNFITTKSWLTNNSDGSGEEYTYIPGD